MNQGNRVYCLYKVSTNKQVDRDEFNQADIPSRETPTTNSRRKWDVQS